MVDKAPVGGTASVLYACSKSDVERLETVARLTGVARDGEAGAALLVFTNRIWRTNTVPSRHISDTMVAIWLENTALRQDMPDLMSEEDQYRLLAWYCCMRPIVGGCRMSREPVDPILARMARELVAESPIASLPYTALMMSVYHARRDVRDAVSLGSGDGRAVFLGWYYSHGLREFDIIHHVCADERAALNRAADQLGYDDLSQLCLFALDWLPHPDFDLAVPADRAKIRAWFESTGSRGEPFASLIDDSPDARVAAGTRPIGVGRRPIAPSSGSPSGLASPAGLDRRPTDPDCDVKYRVEWQTAEYFDRDGSGRRLLLAGEWFPGDERFCWSRPFASVVLRPPEPHAEGVNLGLLLQPGEDLALLPDRRLAIFLNGSAVWEGPVRDAVRGELVLHLAVGAIRPDAHNLLQFLVSEPFVMADAADSDDARKLGVGLRRLWIARAGQRRPDERTATNGRALLPPAPNTAESERLLVLRGDLRSHTGYAKATRALAKLIPARFRTIGVDIHPDPADNQAFTPFAIVPEAEARRQVLAMPSRCAVVHATPPDDFAVWPNAHNFGWFFWETDTIPFLREWPLRLGLMDAIWAPSSFMAEFVRAAGYRGPVHPVAWPEEFADVQTGAGESGQQTVTSYFDKLLDLRQPTRSCTLGELRREARLMFLAVQSLAPRKGLPLLLSEWRSHVERSGGSDVLVLRLAFRHSTGIDGEDWQDVFIEALALAGFRPGREVRIAVIPEAISESELAGLYRTADAFVSMSYGEGFGGPIIEALRNGCPVIAPRHSGLRDSIPADYPLTVASTRMAVALRGNLPAYPHSAAWHVPKAGELREKLEQFAAMTPLQRQALVDQCRSHAMSFCWAPVVRQHLDAALDDIELGASGRAAQPVSTGVVTEDPGRHAAD